jgi:hypothetical protein
MFSLRLLLVTVMWDKSRVSFVVHYFKGSRVTVEQKRPTLCVSGGRKAVLNNRTEPFERMNRSVVCRTSHKLLYIIYLGPYFSKPSVAFIFKSPIILPIEWFGVCSVYSLLQQKLFFILSLLSNSYIFSYTLFSMLFRKWCTICSNVSLLSCVSTESQVAQTFRKFYFSEEFYVLLLLIHQKSSS